MQTYVVIGDQAYMVMIYSLATLCSYTRTPDRHVEGPDTKLKSRVRFEIPPFFIKDFGFQAKIPDSKPSFQFKIY